MGVMVLDCIDRLAPHQKQTIVNFGLLAIVVISSIPFLSRTLLWGADLEFHLLRIEGIAQGLREGQFPVLMQTVQLGGYGYPVSVMYGDIFLYIPAILHILGLSTEMAYRLFALAMNAVTALASYWAFRRIFASRKIGLLASALWTLNTYRLDDMYSRGAVGESIAMLFFPVLLLGIVSIIYPDRRGSAKHGGVVCAISAAGIVVSHVISSVLTVIAIAPILIWAIAKRYRSPRFWKQVITAFALLVLLSAFFLVPMLDYSAHSNLYVFNLDMQSKINLAIRKAIEPGQLLTLFLPLSQIGEGHAFQGDIPYSLGWATILFASLPVLLVLLRDSDASVHDHLGIGLPVLLGALLCLVMSTTLFPWGSQWFADHVSFLYSIQFPTRLLGPAGFLLVVLGAIGFLRLEDSSLFKSLSYAVFIGLFLLGCLEGGVTTSTFMFNAKAEPLVSSSLETSSGVAGCEYVIAGTDLNQLFSEGYKSRSPEASDGITYSGYKKNGTSIRLHADAPVEGEIVLPLFAYPNYSVLDNAKAQKVWLSSTGGSTNLLCLHFPKGFSGDVSVWYKVPLSWRIAELVSCIAWTICLGTLFFDRGILGNISRHLFAQ